MVLFIPLKKMGLCYYLHKVTSRHNNFVGRYKNEQTTCHKDTHRNKEDIDHASCCYE